MRVVLLGLCLLVAFPASSQWTRVDDFFGVGDLYLTNFVAADDSYVYATALAGQPVPNRFLVLRSPDDGASWETTFSGYSGGARGAFLGEIDGSMAALVTGNGETALLLSDDQGATWAETPARLPTSQSKSVARMSGTMVVVGSNPSYRSADGGATWTAFGQDQPMGSVLAFEGAFYGLTGIGQFHRLTGDVWTPVDFGASFATHVWASGGQLWAKASGAAIYGSPNGTNWAQHPTAAPTTWGRALPTSVSDFNRPWFLHNQAAAVDLLLSSDAGESATSIEAGYPRDSNGALCTSNYAVTPRVVIGNAWACSFTDASQKGVFRYAFDTPAAQTGLDPGFGISGKAIFNFGGNGFEATVAVLPLAPEAGFGEGGGIYVVGNRGSIAKLDATGALDASFGTGGIAPTPTSPFPQVNAAASGPDGSVVLMGAASDASFDRVIAWRVTASGALDTSYGTGGYVYPLESSSFLSQGEMLADGSLLAFGELAPAPGQSRTPAVVRITEAGEIDTSYGTNGYVSDLDLLFSTDFAVDAEGRAVLATTGQSFTNTDPIRLLRLTASGQPDASFGSGGVVEQSDLRPIFNRELPLIGVDAQGRILLATAELPTETPVLYRFTASGEMDPSFGTGGRVEVPLAWPSPWIAPDGSVYLTNNALAQGAPPEPRIVHVLPDGTLDPAFGVGGTAQILVSGRQASNPVSLGFDSASRVLAVGTISRSDRFDAYVLRMMPGTIVADEPAPPAPEASGALTLAPNPTRSATSVRLALMAPEAHARVAVYDALGREVALLHTGPLASGEHAFRSPEALAPGVYLVRAAMAERVAARALTIVR